MAEATQQKFEQWAIVDVMGHQRYVGLVTEQVIAGQGFVRVDIPASEAVAAWSKLIGTASIYAITPVAEEIARGLAAREQQRPVQSYELPPQLTGPPVIGGDDDDDDHEDQSW